ncbi:MAG: hypothetical protein U0359_11860 [Byssovorax sp.]
MSERALLVAIACLLSACAAAPSPREPSWLPTDPSALSPSIETWRSLRADLSALRSRTETPRTLKLDLTLREPTTGKVLHARGAAAIAPPGSLRMILLGPGGTTALDLWIHGDDYRFAVPALGLVKRGDAATPPAERRGLPVDFLRFWLLHPARGELLFAERERGGAARFTLRDGDAVVDLRSLEHQRIEARRRTFSARPGEPAVPSDEETVTAEGLGCAAARYHQASTGLDVEVRCEGESLDPPSERAFVDPDAEGGAP